MDKKKLGNPYSLPELLKCIREEVIQEFSKNDSSCFFKNSDIDKNNISIWLFRYDAELDTLFHWKLIHHNESMNEEYEALISNTKITGGLGTVGYVLRTKQSELINQTFADPRGSVSLEDTVIKNYSWMGFPILNENKEVKAILSFFYGVEDVWDLSEKNEICARINAIVENHNESLLWHWHIEGAIFQRKMLIKKRNPLKNKDSDSEYFDLLEKIHEFCDYYYPVLLTALAEKSEDSGKYKISSSNRIHLNVKTARLNYMRDLQACSYFSDACAKKCILKNNNGENHQGIECLNNKYVALLGDCDIPPQKGIYNKKIFTIEFLSISAALSDKLPNYFNDINYKYFQILLNKYSSATVLKDIKRYQEAINLLFMNVLFCVAENDSTMEKYLNLIEKALDDDQDVLDLLKIHREAFIKDIQTKKEENILLTKECPIINFKYKLTDWVIIDVKKGKTLREELKKSAILKPILYAVDQENKEKGTGTNILKVYKPLDGESYEVVSASDDQIITSFTMDAENVEMIWGKREKINILAAKFNQMPIQQRVYENLFNKDTEYKKEIVENKILDIYRPLNNATIIEYKNEAPAQWPFKIGDYYLYIELQNNISGYSKEDWNDIEDYINKTYNEFDILRQQKKSYYYALRSAVTAIMSRNMSHNIGSHVLNYLSDQDNIKNITIKSQCALVEKCPDISSDMQRKLISYLQQYLRQRMDFIASIQTMDPSWTTPLEISEDIIDPILGHMKNDSNIIKRPKLFLLVDNILRSEGITALNIGFELIVKKGEQKKTVGTYLFKDEEEYIAPEYKEEGLRERNTVAMYMGVVGCQAFYSILENYLRNTARHGKRQSIQKIKESKDRLIITLHFDYDINDDYVKISICDNIFGWDKDKDGEWVFRKEKDIKLHDIETALSPKDDWGRLIDDQGKIEEHYWGLKEMRICASFLRGLNVDCYEKTQEVLPIITPFINKEDEEGTNGGLGYHLYLPKSKKVFIIDNDKTFWKKYLEDGIRIEDDISVILKLNENGSLNYEYFLVDKGIYEKHSILRNILPYKTFILSDNTSDDCLRIIDKKEISPNGFEGTKTPSNGIIDLYLYLYHQWDLVLNKGNKLPEIWAKREIYSINESKNNIFNIGKVRCEIEDINNNTHILDHRYDEYVVATQKKPHFHASFASDGIEIYGCLYKILDSQNTDKNKILAFHEINEAGLANVIVIDERIFDEFGKRMFYYKNINRAYYWYLQNVVALNMYKTNDDLVIEGYSFSDINKKVEMIEPYKETMTVKLGADIDLKKFVPSHFENNTHSFIIHQTIINPKLGTQKDYNALLPKFKGYRPKWTIVTSGRGHPIKSEMPEGSRFMDYSNLRRNLIEMPSKYLLGKTMFSLKGASKMKAYIFIYPELWGHWDDKVCKQYGQMDTGVACLHEVIGPEECLFIFREKYLEQTNMANEIFKTVKDTDKLECWLFMSHHTYENGKYKTIIDHTFNKEFDMGKVELMGASTMARIIEHGKKWHDILEKNIEDGVAFHLQLCK